MASEMLSSQNTYMAREAALQSDKSQPECERANGNLGWNEVKRFENTLGKSLSLMPKARYLYGDIFYLLLVSESPHWFAENWKPTPRVRTLKSTQLPSDYNKLLK